MKRSYTMSSRKSRNLKGHTPLATDNWLLATGNWATDHWLLSLWGSIICGEFLPNSLIPGSTQGGRSNQLDNGQVPETGRQKIVARAGNVWSRTEAATMIIQYQLHARWLSLDLALGECSAQPDLQLLLHKKRLHIWTRSVDQTPCCTSLTPYQGRYLKGQRMSLKVASKVPICKDITIRLNGCG